MKLRRFCVPFTRRVKPNCNHHIRWLHKRILKASIPYRLDSLHFANCIDFVSISAFNTKAERKKNQFFTNFIKCKQKEIKISIINTLMCHFNSHFLLYRDLIKTDEKWDNETQPRNRADRTHTWDNSSNSNNRDNVYRPRSVQFMPFWMFDWFSPWSSTIVLIFGRKKKICAHVLKCVLFLLKIT